MSDKNVDTLLDDIRNKPLDDRIMAYLDLGNLVKANSESAMKRIEDICDCIVHTLTKKDEGTETIEVAMKCMEACINKAGGDQLKHLTEALVQKLVEEKKNCDSFMMGLKSIITNANKEYVPMIAGILFHFYLNTIDLSINQLVDALANTTISDDVIYGILFVLVNDFTVSGKTIIVRKDSRQAKSVDEMLKKLINKALELVYHPTNRIGNESIDLLKVLTPHISAKILEEIVPKLLSSMTDKSKCYRSICCLSSILTSTASRLVKYHKEIMEKLKTVKNEQQLSTADQEPCEIIERIQFCYSSLVSTGRDEIRIYIEPMLEEINEDMVFDPNYNYDCAVATPNGGMEVDNEDEEEDDGFEYEDEPEDDDDYGWKIRRGAVQLLNSIVNSKMIPLSKVYALCSETLFLCFREHDELTRLEVIKSAMNLLNKMIFKSDKSEIVAENPSSFPLRGRTQSFRVPLKDDAPALSEKIYELLTSGLSIGIRSQLFAFLSTFFKSCASLGMCVEKQINKVSELIQIHIKNFKDFPDDGKFNILDSLSSFVSFFRDNEITSHLEMILSIVRELSKSNNLNNKLLSTYLSLINTLIVKCSINETNYKIFTNSHNEIYDYLWKLLNSKETEQQIKDSCCDIIGLLIRYFGFPKGTKSDEFYKHISSKVVIDNSRYHAILCIIQIIQTKLKLDLKYFNNDNLLIDLTTYMNHHSRDIQKASINCYKLLLTNLKLTINKEVLQHLLDQINALYHAGKQYYVIIVDMLDILTIIVANNAKVDKNDLKEMTYHMLTYTQFSDEHLNILSDFIIVLSDKSMPLSSILDDYFSYYKTDNEMQSNNTNLAKICAAIITHIVKNSKENPIEKLYQSKQNDNIIPLYFKVIGQFGFINPILKYLPSFDKDIPTLMTAYTDPVIISSISYCFALSTLGSMKELFPLLLKYCININTFHFYSSLHTLVQTIRNKNISTSIDNIKEIVKLLNSKLDCDNDSIRNFIISTYSNLVLINPRTLAELTELLYGKNNLQITSILTIISGSVNESTSNYIVSHFKKIVELIKNEDINIKRESLSVTLSLLKYSPILLRDLIIENNVLDILYELIKKNNAYITSVQIGPVQNEEDYGTPIRRIAYTILKILIDVYPQLIDINKICDELINGCKDTAEIENLSSHILSKVIQLSPSWAEERAPKIIELLEKRIFNSKKEPPSEEATTNYKKVCSNVKYTLAYASNFRFKKVASALP